MDLIAELASKGRKERHYELKLTLNLFLIIVEPIRMYQIVNL